MDHCGGEEGHTNIILDSLDCRYPYLWDFVIFVDVA
jgi:hypothetical protein